MLNRVRTYSHFVKIEHSIFAFPLILAGAVMAAGGWPSLLRFFLILLAGAGARTVAFTLNRVMDQKIDALNPRTAARELPSGRMTLFEAVMVGVAGLLIYLAAAFILMRGLGLLLAPIPLIVFTIYPLLKRFTALAHFGVGLADALAPLGGWVAITALNGSASRNSMAYLFFFTFFWVSGFDIIYATMDEAFDRAQGLHSLPAKLGRKKALWVSAGLHLAAFVTLGVLYVSYYRTPVAGVLLCATGVLLFLEQYLADNVDLAFFKINGLISFLVLAFVWTGASHL